MDRARQDLDTRRASFLHDAANYERTRPSYPVEAVLWIVGEESAAIVDIGCGPGTLTAMLSDLGHRVVGIDRSMAMLEVVAMKGLPALCGAAEALPVRDGWADVVTAATSFHWFDHERAVPEMRRVLRRGGRAGVLAHIRDESVPWVAALSGIIGSEVAMAATLGGAERMEEELGGRLTADSLFEDLEHRVFDFEQELTLEDLIGLVRSRSYIAAMDPGERDRVLEDVRRLWHEHPQLAGRPVVALPYKTHALRATAAS